MQAYLEVLYRGLYGCARGTKQFREGFEVASHEKHYEVSRAMPVEQNSILTSLKASNFNGNSLIRDAAGPKMKQHDLFLLVLALSTIM